MTYGRVYVFFYEEVVRASSILKARDKQPQVRLFTSIYDFTTGADPGFWERGLINIFTTGGGYGRGTPPPVTARGLGRAFAFI